MDWWNELWLNEGFATWVGWLAVDHFYPGEYRMQQPTGYWRSLKFTDWNIWSQFVVRNSRGKKFFPLSAIDIITG